MKESLTHRGGGVAKHDAYKREQDALLAEVESAMVAMWTNEDDSNWHAVLAKVRAARGVT